MNANQVYLHTGTNLGNREANLQRANEWIEEEIGPIEQVSKVYRTKAWGITDQPDFLNQALLVGSLLSPFELLERIHAIERRMGRVREIKWGERIIDIDILFFNDEIIDTEKLTIPHPYLHYRNFVLLPLMDIAPGLLHPGFKLTIAELFANSEDTLRVEVVK
ncbi:MAG: 2-amino-4-hydroxy-6-hydroxymethyldihydropteridine diphosphokinase [Lewinellaceae bacterium]|nr:2-amino-4-hydroxy-6-hydroxymethyldihydropteridine diphosphokinase [Phaeodactylibacter sp.]MCB0615684.1 2-amino-4-hydroxy-6-hydroxymethyldihydropteridine diphosphokinase [Phaeodactylibacter sp.]MCB9350212.1 2-amino-4-hydroxy-6-hydroxymethyldihydropteridine diphosphokinase [Lewinellaceae bacterium]